MLKKTAISLALLGALTAHADVLTTVKPLGFIANAITDGVTDTQVLLPTSASPHDYSLKPSDVQKLQSAQLVVWVGEGLEGFLEKSVDKLPKEKVLTLDEIPAIEVLIAKGEPHSHDHDHDDHKHGEKGKEKAHHHDDDEHEHHHHHDKDWHIWFSPQISEIVAEQIADRLSQQLPDQKAKIAANLAEFKQNLAMKNEALSKQLEPIKHKGYYTFHDAYGYFEKAYGLHSLGSFTINPTIAPGAKTLEKIKKDIAEHQAQCLFTEPQFTPKVVESLSKNTQVAVSQLDPLGAKVQLSKTAYPEFLQSIADQFSGCLAK